MLISLRIRTSLFALTLALVAATGTTADEPKSILHYIAEVPGGVTNPNVPMEPLQEADVERWTDMLTASEEQVHFIERMYRRFVERHNAFLEREAPMYVAKCAELSEIVRAEGLSSPAIVEAARTLDRASMRFRRQLTALEHEFIDSIEPALSEEQRERLVILRHEATRRNCRTFACRMRWGQVELRDVWREAAATYASPDEEELAQRLLADYESRLTPLICRRADLHFETRHQLTANRVVFMAGEITSGERANRYRQIKSRAFDAARRVRRLQERTVETIADSVSEEVASQFIAGAKQAAFPELYPDSNALHMLFEALQGDDDLHEDARLSVDRLYHDYMNQYERICSELEATCIKWGDKTVRGITGYESQLLPEALEPDLHARTELSRKTLVELQLAIEPGVLKRHADLIPDQFELADVDEPDEG